MDNHNQIIVLGTGTSTGVPIVGCHCQVCQSDNVNNKRLRTSIMLKTKHHKNILIDTTPDLRTQLLRENIDRIDGAIITHDHADHTHGIDDLRPYCFWQNQHLPLFTNDLTIKSLTEKFRYIFDFPSISNGGPVLGGGIPKLKLNPVDTMIEHEILGESFIFWEMPHGYTKTLSFIHSKFAYIVDCKVIPSTYLDILRAKKLEVLIIDCIKEAPHDTHLHLDLALEYISYIKPNFAGLIHLGHELEHDALIAKLDSMKLKHVRPLFDRQILYYQ